MIDSTLVKALAAGRCGEIVQTLAPHLAAIIERGRRHGPCPLCGGKDRARCHNDFDETGGVFCNKCGGGADLFATLIWANGWDFLEAAQAVANYLGLAGDEMPPTLLRQQALPAPEPKDWSQERERLRAIWDNATPDSGRIGEYLRSRGISLQVPPSLQLHRNLIYFHQGPKVRYPAMLAQIVLGGKCVGLHQTWLDPDGSGKAPVSQPRKIRKCSESISGGAIPLFPLEPGKPLALAEGIETALAVREITGFSAWACVNASMLAKVEVPPSVDTVYIAADKDRSGAGQRAAATLAERLHADGKRIKIAVPPIEIPDDAKSVDWLDCLLALQEVAHV